MVNPAFQLPSQKEKETYVHQLFQRIASRYNIMNDLMTGGLHRQWKFQASQLISPVESSPRLLDVCTGTGDLLFTLNRCYPNSNLVGIDFSSNMLSIAKERLNKKNIPAELVEGDVLNLPFESKSIDGAIVSYGLRNVSNYEKCLTELHRVLKPGARLVILDMSHPKGLSKLMSSFYRFSIVPLMGKLFAKNANAYQYLTHSIHFYPDQEALKALMTKSGFCNVNYRNKFDGICSIHWGNRPNST
ncbi:MAG: bifunctional demethylmenaquinone methyltransferase/2-methoxy-6-polyprenyl-1,4-benzoquinol methylase UbiE [Cyanobacteria bacterium P01_H01_bin.74]